MSETFEDDVPAALVSPLGSAYHRPLRHRQRFWLLRWCVWGGYLLAALLVLLTLLGSVVMVLRPEVAREAGGFEGPVLPSVLLAWIALAVWLLPLLIALQLIDVLLAIETNTRRK